MRDRQAQLTALRYDISAKANSMEFLSHGDSCDRLASELDRALTYLSTKGTVAQQTTQYEQSQAGTSERISKKQNASHVVAQRKTNHHEATVCPHARPTLFVGSTVEALEVARAAHAELDHDLDVTLWNHGLFPPGITTWAQLTKVTGDYDFALFVFSGDDHVLSRGQENLAVRDNLLIEYGLFVGVLGAERAFFMYNRDRRPKIASDLGGVTPLEYRDRNDDNLRAAVSPACSTIRQVVRKIGKIAH